MLISNISKQTEYSFLNDISESRNTNKRSEREESRNERSHVKSKLLTWRSGFRKDFPKRASIISSVARKKVLLNNVKQVLICFYWNTGVKGGIFSLHSEPYSMNPVPAGINLPIITFSFRPFR